MWKSGRISLKEEESKVDEANVDTSNCVESSNWWIQTIKVWAS